MKTTRLFLIFFVVIHLFWGIQAALSQTCQEVEGQLIPPECSGTQTQAYLVSSEENYYHPLLVQTSTTRDVIVTQTGDLRITSGEAIEFKLGFGVKWGGKVHAQIGSRPNVALVLGEDNTLQTIQTVSILPDKYSLVENYPNPFNATTTINYSLPEDVHVRLVVYDVLGQPVKELVNSSQEAGYQSVIWDATNGDGHTMPSGTYLYNIMAGTFVQTRYMTLVR
jgi:hypothetical protein